MTPAPRPAIRRATADDAAGIEAVRVATWRATYRGIVPDAFLDAMDPDAGAEKRRPWLTHPDRAPYLAEEDGRVVAMALGGPNRGTEPDYPAELYALYVLPSLQRRGLGRLLVLAVAGDLAARGHRAMIVWVLEENAPGRRFYESLGARPLGGKTFELGGAALEEVGYGWDDLGALAESLGRAPGSGGPGPPA